MLLKEQPHNTKMNKTITCTFNIFLSDGFENAVRSYFRNISQEENKELSMEEIKEFLEVNMMPARSIDDSFEIEGGDTDGWFIQSVEF